MSVWSLDDNPAYRSLTGNPVGAFVDSVLRGTGQVMFQNNPITGLLFLIGIFYNSITLGVFALLGNVAATLAAMALGSPAAAVRNGLFGFNGTLTGIALAFFLQPSTPSVLYVIVGAILSTVIMGALLDLLSPWDVAPLTAPFVLTTWILLLASYRFGMLEGAQSLPAARLPALVQPLEPVTQSVYIDGFLKGVAQVFFQNNSVTGAIFVVAILVNSRISALFAALGSAIALLVALALGAPRGEIGLGLFGFNSVLTGIALGGLFFVLTWASAVYTLIGIVVTAIAFPAIADALAPVGMPALTAPFVIVTWLFIFGKKVFQRLMSVPIAELSSAEGNLRWFQTRRAERTEREDEQRAA